MWIVLLVGAFFGQDLYGQCSLTINPATGMLNCKSTGTAGPVGATGPTGPAGPTGATGATGTGLVDCAEAGGQMSCPAGYVSGATAAGAVVTKEASVNGTDAITVGAPDSVSASYRINYPADPPTVAGQALRAGTPSGGITQYTHAIPIWTGTSNPNGYFDWTLGAAPGNPTAGNIRLYPKTGSTLCARDSAGTETCYGSGGGNSAQWHHVRGAVCQNTVAGAGFSTPSTNAPTAACDSGTNTLFGVLQFTEASTQSAQTWFQLPDSFTSAEVEFYWRTSATSGDVAWQVQTACLATSEALGNAASGGPSWNTTQEITSTADGTARDIVRIALTSLTTTGCAANELLLLRLSRDPTDAQDTIAATAELVSMSIKVTP